MYNNRNNRNNKDAHDLLPTFQNVPRQRPHHRQQRQDGTETPVNLREPYTGGVQTYKGLGVVKYCLICGCHRPTAGGFLKAITGGKHWVCERHNKVVKSA
jgi:hypothetical protein